MYFQSEIKQLQKEYTAQPCATKEHAILPTVVLLAPTQYHVHFPKSRQDFKQKYPVFSGSYSCNLMNDIPVSFLILFYSFFSMEKLKEKTLLEKNVTAFKMLKRKGAADY